jgi:hypothetical protein
VQATIGVPQVYNNTMVGNILGLQMPIITPDAPTSDVVVSNNLIAFNQVGLNTATGLDGLLPGLHGNLVYGNTTADYQGVADQTGTHGNISADPRLEDRANGDVHLLLGSPAIDAGDGSLSQVSSTDFYGNARGSTSVDIGAVEYQASAIAAVDGSITTMAGTAKAGTLAASGAAVGEAFIFSIVTQPSHGSVALSDAASGTFDYLPADGYVGADSFRFEITDGNGNMSNVATEQVSISDIAPSVSDGAVSTQSGLPVSGTLSVTPAYVAQRWHFVLASKAAHGTVSVMPGTGRFTYVPAAGFAGSDSFRFQVVDSFGTASAPATETITVQDVAPQAINASIKVVPNRPYQGALKTQASRGQSLNYTVISNPAHGTLTVNSLTGAFTYTPDHGYRGRDSFTFQAADGRGTLSNVATVNIQFY